MTTTMDIVILGEATRRCSTLVLPLLQDSSLTRVEAFRISSISSWPALEEEVSRKNSPKAVRPKNFFNEAPFIFLNYSLYSMVRFAPQDLRSFSFTPSLYKTLISANQKVADLWLLFIMWRWPELNRRPD